MQFVCEEVCLLEQHKALVRSGGAESAKWGRRKCWVMAEKVPCASRSLSDYALFPHIFVIFEN
jgi:hypothetical protein